MKSVLMSWAMSALIAICLTPGFGHLTQTSPPPHPAMLAQDDGPVALPGSADAPEPNAADDENNQPGQAANNGQALDGQMPGDPEAAQQPPQQLQQPPADDNDDDAAAQQQQQPGDNEEGGGPIAPQNNGDDNND
jgi:hypothetical protein